MRCHWVVCGTSERGKRVCNRKSHFDFVGSDGGTSTSAQVSDSGNPATSRSCSAIRPPPSKRRLSDRLSRRLGPGSARPFDRTSFEDGASVFGRAHRAGIQLGGTSRCSEGFSCVSSFHFFLFRICPPKFSKFSRQWGARIGVSGGFGI